MFFMTIPLSDRGKYYRGLLVLTGRDRIVDARERELLLRIGAILDFDKRFCETAIDELLRNRYITQDPVVFSESRIAECFLRDAIRLSLVDNGIHHHEFVWLKRVARSNGVSGKWLKTELAVSRAKDRSPDSCDFLEVRHHL